MEGNPESPGERNENFLKDLNRPGRAQQRGFQRPHSGEKTAEQIGTSQREHEGYGQTFH